MECLDFLEFQDVIKKMRELDDKLVYTLNANVPTPSFRGQTDPSTNCKQLYALLHENFGKRDSAIRNCISVTSGKVNELKEKRDGGGGDAATARLLNKEQTKLRVLRSELNVEEVVRDRSTKLYYERCRQFYKPPDMNFP